MSLKYVVSSTSRLENAHRFVPRIKSANRKLRERTLPEFRMEEVYRAPYEVQLILAMPAPGGTFQQIMYKLSPPFGVLTLGYMVLVA